jgi:hypothetical protein
MDCGAGAGRKKPLNTGFHRGLRVGARRRLGRLRLAFFLRLQRAQEVQQVLLILFGKLLVVVDDGIGFGIGIAIVSVARVAENCLDEVRGAAVMQEEDSLT